MRKTKTILRPIEELRGAKLARFKARPDATVVAFDLDNTLYPTTSFARTARINAIRAMIGMGLNIDDKRLYRMLRTIVKETGSNYGRHFDVLCERLGLGTLSPLFVAAAVKAYHETKEAIQPYSEVPHVLSLLNEQSHLLVVATEGQPVKQWDKLLRLGLYYFFYDVFITDRKDIATYERIVAELGVASSSIVMIGDSPAADIEPAKSVGMRTVRVLRGRFRKLPCTCADFVLNDLSQLPEIIDSRV